jgi:hypothetical protein
MRKYSRSEPVKEFERWKKTFAAKYYQKQDQMPARTFEYARQDKVNKNCKLKLF